MNPPLILYDLLLPCDTLFRHRIAGYFFTFKRDMLDHASIYIQIDLEIHTGYLSIDSNGINSYGRVRVLFSGKKIK